MNNPITDAIKASRAERRRRESKRAFPQNPEGFGAALLEEDEIERGLETHHWNARAPPHGVGAMSIQTFCTWAGIGLSKAYSEISAGRLTICKVGRKTLIRMSDAQTWLEQLPTPDLTNRYGSPKSRKLEKNHT